MAGGGQRAPGHRGGRKVRYLVVNILPSFWKKLVSGNLASLLLRARASSLHGKALERSQAELPVANNIEEARY